MKDGLGSHVSFYNVILDVISIEIDWLSCATLSESINFPSSRGVAQKLGLSSSLSVTLTYTCHFHCIAFPVSSVLCPPLCPENKTKPALTRPRTFSAVYWLSKAAIQSAVLSSSAGFTPHDHLQPPFCSPTSSRLSHGLTSPNSPPHHTSCAPPTPPPPRSPSPNPRISPNSPSRPSWILRVN
jgi:hypothetical protein